MINTFPFLNPDERKDILSRLTGLEDQMIERKSSDFKILASPTYTWNTGNPYDKNSIDAHNKRMLTIFPELLRKTVTFFQEMFGEEVYFDERICFPGFHLINIHPRSDFGLNFHYDYDEKTVQDLFPDLDIMKNESAIRFTVLLTDEPDLDSGLYFFDQSSDLLKKILLVSPEGSKRQEVLKARAGYHQYTPGIVNTHLDLYHSIGCTNHSDVMKRRITFQGNLARSKKGRLLFW